MLKIHSDVVLLPVSTEYYPDRWVALNVFARTSLGLSSKVLTLLSGGQDNISGMFTVWHIARFSNEDGLLADPSRFQRDLSKWQEEQVDINGLLSHLRTQYILIDDEIAYQARFSDKQHILDKSHFGTFHQQHGQHMFLQRKDAARWWMDQKFTPDRLSVKRETLYGAVQASYLEGYFKKVLKPGVRVLDLGCGTGIYTNLMALTGADVLGIDPSEDYLEVARQNTVSGTSFEQIDSGVAGGMDSLPTESFDFVFMSDALLFYYRSFYPNQEANISVLLADIRRILKPYGRFISLEPHGAFYLTPWLGSPERPFTILSEYQNKHYGIVPPFSWLFSHLRNAELAVSGLEELWPAEYFKDLDVRAYHFANQFPQWQLLEIVKL